MAVTPLRRLALLAALCVLMPTTADAEAQDALRFEDAYRFSTHREDVDVSRHPWSAIGALYNGSGSSCTGVVVARNRVVTAAHCVYNKRSRRFVPPDSLHFLAGYRSGRHVAHARVAYYEVGAGYDPLQYSETIGADWVVLTLTDRLPSEIVPLRLSAEWHPSGTRVEIAGYRQDRRHAMTADRECAIDKPTNDGGLLLHTCEGSRGYSGAPILVRTEDDNIEVAAIHIAVSRADGNEQMLAVPANVILRHSASLADQPPTRLADLAAGERVPVMGGQDDIRAPRDVGERAPHLFQVVIDAGRDRLADVEVNLAGDVADDRGRPLPGLDEDALVPGRMAVLVEHAVNPGERIAIAFNQIQAIP
jgi:protease YdgD